MWTEFEGYNDTERKLNVWLIDKGQCIVVRDDLFHIKSTGFRNICQSTTVTNQC